MNVMALLPYMVEHYEEPNELCTEAANNIAQVIIWLSKNTTLFPFFCFIQI